MPEIAPVPHGRGESPIGARGGPSPTGCRDYQPSDGEGAVEREQRGKAADGTLLHQG